MIELVNLTKQFDDFIAVDQVTLSVAAGEILALLGPNGAGKTTTVRMLAAILRPTAGRASVAGYDVTEHPQEIRRRVGLLTEHPGLYLRMKGKEYLRFFGRLMGLDADESERRARDLLTRFGMPKAWERRMGTYSKGMRQKMALVRAMLHDPSVLLLDEPTSAMDPHSAKLVRDAVLSLRHHQRAIIICTHNLAEAEELADRIAIIRRGRIIALGTSAELKSSLLGPPLIELRLTRSIDGPHSDGPHSDGPHSDGPHSDGPHSDGPHSDGPHSDGPHSDGVVKLVSDLVEIRARGENWLRYSTPNPQETNPLLLRTLASHEVGVVTLSLVPRSLEDVYLRVVEE